MLLCVYGDTLRPIASNKILLRLKSLKAKTTKEKQKGNRKKYERTLTLILGPILVLAAVKQSKTKFILRRRCFEIDNN